MDSWISEEPLEKIKDADVRYESYLRGIHSMLTDLHLGTMGLKDEDSPFGEYGENSLFYDLTASLRVIGENLAALSQRGSGVVGWTLAGLAVGYIVAKI